MTAHTPCKHLMHQRTKTGGNDHGKCGATDGGLTYFGQRVTCLACIALKPITKPAYVKDTMVGAFDGIDYEDPSLTSGGN